MRDRGYDAGCGQSGMVEEISEAEIRAQLETNLLGALWVTQAALPYLREQGSGHIVQVSSIGGISAFPNTGAYHASQWALEGLTQSLAAEVARFGVKVTLIVPTGYTMDWAGYPASPATELPAYEPVRMRAVLKLVDSPNPPLRLFLGEAPSQAGFTGAVAASRNPARPASRGRKWPLVAMTAIRLASNG